MMSWHNYYYACAIVLISPSTWLWSNLGCFIGLITGYWKWPRSRQSDPYYDVWLIMMTSHHCAMVGWSYCVFLQQIILVLFNAENSSSSAEAFTLQSSGLLTWTLAWTLGLSRIFSALCSSILSLGSLARLITTIRGAVKQGLRLW